ncbi:MAG: hypothetical protein DMG65_12160 [Candidatus Angelobacter sp. Gp1-AA117]|nr:MAG: hypothetical protein DMG65_12160 [Candidatus Angelobacter sp. Gp1-AA117]
MNSKLASFAVGRRTIALALFSGQELECFEIRSLPNDKTRAKSAAAAFVQKPFDAFQFGTAALESEPDSSRREDLREVIHDTLREQGIPILEASESQLFAAFRNPSITLRGDLRKAICSIFPLLSEHKNKLQLLDAVALGLHLTTERILAINNHNE